MLLPIVLSVQSQTKNLSTFTSTKRSQFRFVMWVLLALQMALFMAYFIPTGARTGWTECRMKRTYLPITCLSCRVLSQQFWPSLEAESRPVSNQPSTSDRPHPVNAALVQVDSVSNYTGRLGPSALREKLHTTSTVHPKLLSFQSTSGALPPD